MSITFSQLLAKHQPFFGRIVPFSEASERLVALDLSTQNGSLTPEVYTSVDRFSAFIDQQLQQANAKYGIGGYMEQRKVYSQSAIFMERQDHGHAVAERTLHVGVDVWGPAGTPVRAPWGGSVHSLGFNQQPGDYGATIILQHQLDGYTFYTLYGHLSLSDLKIGENHYVSIGETFAHFGSPKENGGWPPHLHFQIIQDMEGKMGDYPGVVELAKADYYAQNCPNPDLLLHLNRFLPV
ncbi:MAG: peptidase M23 [Bacteroidetes bacterium]|nr:MAG: peptidase M23 [Bacteroidota bacterium]